MNLKFDKEIPDVFELLILGAGRLVLHVTEERKAIVLDNVLFINSKEERAQEDDEPARSPRHDGPGSRRALSRQSSAVSLQPSVFSRQPSVFSRQSSAVRKRRPGAEASPRGKTRPH